MNKTRAGSLVLLAAGLYGVVLSLRLPLGRWNEPGAGAFPLIVSALLILFGAGLFLTHTTRLPIDWRELVRAQWTPFRIVALTLAFILALDPLGFPLAATVYLFVLLFWVSGFRVWLAAAFALTIGMVSWYVFARLFETPLPKGFLGL